MLLPHLRLGIIQTSLASALAARSVAVVLSFGFFSVHIVSRLSHDAHIASSTN